jgi:hypothetical protein
MGNVHAFAHRVTALSMACLASAGLILCSLSGFGCSFLVVNAKPDRSVMTPRGQEFLGQEMAFLGVQCDSPFFEETDRMWNLSQLFLLISLILGGLTTVLAWALGTFVPPNKQNWRAVSILAAVTAVMEVPIFLIFESEPCNMDINRQTCSMTLGSYFNMTSIALWVAMTLWTQFLRPPNWSREVDAWRSSGIKVNEITIPSLDENGTDISNYEHESPRTGDILVTSNDPGIAVWDTRMGSGHNKHRVVEQDGISDVSSIGFHDGKKDVETGESPIEIQRAASMKDAVDKDIRKGASIVINTIRGKPQSSRNSTKEYKLPRIEVSTAGTRTNDVRRSVVGTSIDRMRANSALMDSEYSAFTDDNPGIKLTIICPDGSKEEAKFGIPMSSCLTGGRQVVIADENDVVVKCPAPDPEPAVPDPDPVVPAQPEILKDPTDVVSEDQDEQELRMPVKEKMATEEVMPPLSLHKMPISSLDIAPDDDGVSEMTGHTEFVSAESEKSYFKDTLSILQDLAQTY